MELYIEGKRTDLAPGEVFAVTVQSNDVTKPDRVQSSYSNTLTLPFTEANHAALGHASEPTSQHAAPYRQLDALILQDGVEVVAHPKAYLQEANEGYEVQLFSGSVDFFARLEDKSIRDLDLSKFDHIWNTDAVAAGAAFFRTYVHGYIYELIDRGKPLNRGDLYPGDLYPSVFVRAIYAQLMQEAGVKWTLNNPTFDKLLLPFCNTQPVHTPEWVSARQYILPITNNTPVIPLHYGEVEIILSADIVKLHNTQESYLEVVLQHVSGVPLNAPKLRLSVTAIGKQEAKATFKISSMLDLSIIEFKVSRVNLRQEGGFRGDDAWFSSLVIRASYKPVAYFKTDWTVALNLPDIKQKDFFKMVNALFNLMPSFEPYSQTMHLVPMQTLEENKSRALDWSEKLVYTENRRVPVQYRFGEFAQQSWFRYAADERGGNGDSFLAIEDQQLDKDKTVLTLPVAASAMTNGALQIPQFEEESKTLTAQRTLENWKELLASGPKEAGELVYLKDAVTGNPYTGLETQPIYKGGATYRRYGFWQFMEADTVYKSVAVKPRLSLHHPEQLAVTLKEGAGRGRNLQMNTSTFAGLDFETLLNTYYPVLQGILHRCKGITPAFLLSAQDVQNYDCSVPIWLEQYREYFYLNEITEWTGKGPTECQLWRL